MTVQIGDKKITEKGNVLVMYLDGGTVLYTPGASAESYLYINPTTVKSVQVNSVEKRVIYSLI